MVIENKELGLKVAENPDEALWIRVRDNTKARITDLENTLKVETELLKIAESKIKHE